MSQQPLSIVGSGRVTAVGLSAPASCAAIRCGINNFQETRFMDSSGEWIVASQVPLGRPWRGPEKLARMLASVIKESFETDPLLSVTTTPVIVCFSERERPGRAPDMNEQVMALMQQLLDFQLHPDSFTISQGRVGGAVALREARHLLYTQRAPAVVIAAVDSYLSAGTLTAFDEQRRLLTPANSNGFVPGEGASAVIVKRLQPSKEPQLVLMGLGFGVERPIGSDEPLRADGLVQAINAALAEACVEMGSLDFRIADVSGEQYWFKEASIAVTRKLRTRKKDFDIWHAADCIGEAGSIVGPVALNVAWAASERGYSKGRNILCHFGNDDGKRAATIMTFQPVENHGQ